jgi:hypothetical protein
MLTETVSTGDSVFHEDRWWLVVRPTETGATCVDHTTMIIKDIPASCYSAKLRRSAPATITAAESGVSLDATKSTCLDSAPTELSENDVSLYVALREKLADALDDYCVLRKSIDKGWSAASCGNFEVDGETVDVEWAEYWSYGGHDTGWCTFPTAHLFLQRGELERVLRTEVEEREEIKRLEALRASEKKVEEKRRLYERLKTELGES